MQKWKGNTSFISAQPKQLETLISIKYLNMGQYSIRWSEIWLFLIHLYADSFDGWYYPFNSNAARWINCFALYNILEINAL